MKRLLTIISLIITFHVSAKSVDVGGAVYELKFSDFEAITKPYSGTEAIVAYQAKLDVDGDPSQDLNYRVGGKVYTRWFAGNMAASLSVTCSSLYTDKVIFIGEDMDFGVRYNGVSYLAKPKISKMINTGGNCQKLTVRIDKEGHLSRQFYTRVTDLQFSVQILENVYH
ncbi:hypothetical protein [Pseudoalteromonas ostreae]|uniref:hypothetical protein n=1 Tax=Pseudoalteromonas ostreae TaxID=2774154 RepID=UPI001B364754|nr:hypothetical protein [Pseudoalteromonas ostreae]